MHPLVPGTRVGAWRVKAWQGQGAYGAVYQVVLGQQRIGWVCPVAFSGGLLKQVEGLPNLRFNICV